MKVFLFAILLGVSFSDVVAAPLNSEQQLWTVRAALIDPYAYEYVSGADWSRTVPKGETWYLASAWWVEVGPSHEPMFLRALSARDDSVVTLPAGTTIRSSGNPGAHAYFCEPARVVGDARYRNPKKLYHDRLARLSTLPLYTLHLVVPKDLPQSAREETRFPTDFRAGMVTWISTMDVAWTGLTGPRGSMNTDNEVSDDHQWRAARALLIPFERATFTGISTRAASTAGTAAEFKSLPGFSAVGYVKLPVNW